MEIEKIHYAVDSLGLPVKPKPKMRRTLKIGVALLVTALMVGGAYAGLLTYFGEVHTTLEAKQSIVISGEDGIWKNWDQPIERDLGEVVHCTDYCYKLKIWNRACVDANVWFDEIPVQCDPEGIDINHYIFGGPQTIRLVQKEVIWGQSPWTELVDGMEATLTFNTCGPTFDWSIESEDNLDGYCLIYYANYPEYWEGAPAALVLGGLSGSVDVPTMPYIDDENALRPISDEGESYCHQYGAKFWLVPIDAVNNGEIDWGMAKQFLFETDLGFYLDCDDWEPDCIGNVFSAFHTDVVKSESVYCWISCYHVDFDIIPGHYAFDTYLYAGPVQQLK